MMSPKMEQVHRLSAALEAHDYILRMIENDYTLDQIRTHCKVMIEAIRQQTDVLFNELP